MHGAAAQDVNSCKLESFGTAQVAAVRDARSLLLADGREVRLAGIEAARTGDLGAEAAIAALTSIAAGREVTLKRAATREDRYGRIPAYVFTDQDARSAQEQLLAAGHARVSVLSDRGCFAMLAAQERIARDAKHGVWADNVAPRSTTQAGEITSAQGRFAVLEGVVASVRESRGVVYVNFGRRIPNEFTVTILKRNERSFTAAGLEPKKLEGKRVRVRGWIEQRRGPVIEATQPGQIELAGLN
jgi:endonuclease YncB( thermonuclease family)